MSWLTVWYLNKKQPKMNTLSSHDLVQHVLDILKYTSECVSGYNTKAVCIQIYSVLKASLSLAKETQQMEVIFSIERSGVGNGVVMVVLGKYMPYRHNNPCASYEGHTICWESVWDSQPLVMSMGWLLRLIGTANARDFHLCLVPTDLITMIDTTHGLPDPGIF